MEESFGEEGVGEESGKKDPCPRCEGTGWLIEDDEGVGAARRCPCHETRRGERLFAAAGIPPSYLDCRLEDFKTYPPDPALKAQLKKALAVSRRYVDEFFETDGSLPRRGLLFTGRAGAGKTHLAVAVLQELISRYRVHGRFVELTSLIHDIQATFDPRSPSSKSQVLEPHLDAEVLVLDELGAQKATPWVEDLLYLLINHRYTHRLPTLFTTNYSLQAAKRKSPRTQNLDRGPDEEISRFDRDRYGPLSERLPAMLISRLYEMATPVVLDAVHDYRQDILAGQTRV